MDYGPLGQHGPHAAGPVEQEIKLRAEPAPTLLLQMVVWIVQEMQQKHKAATTNPVQLVLISISIIFKLWKWPIFTGIFKS